MYPAFPFHPSINWFMLNIDQDQAAQTISLSTSAKLLPKSSSKCRENLIFDLRNGQCYLAGSK